jgi:hypothetical protein
MTIYSKNRIPNEYYVYVYLRETDSPIAKAGTPYYVGKGIGRRAWHKDHTVHKPKDKKLIVVCEQGLTELGAWAIERRLIKWHGRINMGTGILRNMTDGGPAGNSRKGRKNSKKWHERMSGKSSPRYDHTIYCFENIHTLEVVNMTRQDFINKYFDGVKGGISSIVRGVKCQHKGWHIKGHPLSSGTKGIYNGMHDPKLYNWINLLSGETLMLSKYHFRIMTGATASNICKHINHPIRYKSIKGWSVVR